MKKSASSPEGNHSRRGWEKAVLRDVFHYHQKPGCHPSPAVVPPYYERIELMTGGRGWISDEGNWREVLPGHLLWNKPGNFTIGRSDFENPYRCLSITLLTLCRAGSGMPRFSEVANLEEAVNFTTECVKLFQGETFDRRVLRDYLLSRLLFWIRLQKHQSRRTEYPLGIRGALEWIEKHFAQPCPIRQLADQAGWSVPHFHDAFQKHLGTTPHKVLARHRLRAARERLVSTSDPVKRIATECGFADASALTHAFRAESGLAPSAYRKRYVRLDFGSGRP